MLPETITKTAELLPKTFMSLIVGSVHKHASMGILVHFHKISLACVLRKLRDYAKPGWQLSVPAGMKKQKINPGRAAANCALGSGQCGQMRSAKTKKFKSK